jgi:NAD(P)-dependent dehydrogenase (short-subunit alcohol dehydrogenase family)
VLRTLPKEGSVTLLSDPLSSIYNSPLPSYSASKAALNVMMVEHSKKLGPKGVKVFAVCPGFVCSNIRGKKQEQINGHGRAGNPLVSGQLVLDIIQGKRDHVVGRCIHKDGVYPWWSLSLVSMVDVALIE